LFSLRLGYNAELLHEAQGIEPFPDCDELAASNAVNLNRPNRDILVGGGIPSNSPLCVAVSGSQCPALGYLVPFDDNVIKGCMSALLAPLRFCS